MDTRLEYINQQLTSVDGYAPSERITKHIKMSTEPFVFFRGSSQLFYADIKSSVLALPKALSAIPDTVIMGDCHLSNFGFLTEEGSHGDSVVFAPNDFDDACIGPAVWDISRFIISLVLGVQYGSRVVKGELITDGKFIGKAVVTEEQIKVGVSAFFEAYLACCKRSADSVETLYQALEFFEDDHLLSKFYHKALRRSAGGVDFKTKSRLAKAVEWRGTCIKFKQDPNKFQPIEPNLYQDIEHTFAPYVDDKILDITARLGSGTGSLNLSRFYLLVGPKDFSGEQDLPLCHIVEVKQQRKAAPLYHFDNISPVNRLNPAHLTIQCQRRMQRSPDLVLDEVIWQEKYWLIRSRHHAKVGITPENVVLGKRAAKKGGFVQYAQACGEALALAHCRGDKRSTRFEMAVLEKLPASKDELIDICFAYAKQVQQDTEYLRQLIDV